jgi:hypothetical protein
MMIKARSIWAGVVVALGSALNAAPAAAEKVFAVINLDPQALDRLTRAHFLIQTSDRPGERIILYPMGISHEGARRVLQKLLPEYEIIERECESLKKCLGWP